MVFNNVMNTETTRIISVSMPRHLADQLDSEAQKFLRSRSSMVRIALENMLHNPSTAKLARQTLAAPDGNDKRGAPG